ncbi:MAG: ATP-dependent Clp protease ATP-binding subunit, partial [Pseudomonadota bacterium]
MSTSNWPRWIADLHRLLPVRAQFVLTGNVRDVFLTPGEDGTTLTSLVECLWEALTPHGYQFLAVHDRADGLRVYPPGSATEELASQLLGVRFQGGQAEISLAQLPRRLRALVQSREVRAAVILDFAARLVVNPQQLSEPEVEFFAACEKLAQIAHPLARPGDSGAPIYNPLLWVCPRDTDLPSWYLLDNEPIHGLALAKPHFEERQTAAMILAPSFTGFDEADTAARDSFTRSFAELSEGMTLKAMLDITQLARAQHLGLAEIADAVRSYQVGTLDNPWKRDYLRDKIRAAEVQALKRVKGQPQAVIKAVDILMRSVMGLTGAHTTVRSGR